MGKASSHASHDAGENVRIYERALNPALHGCETFDFARADLAGLQQRLAAYPAFSVHAPLPTPADYPGGTTTSFLLDPDPRKRQASLDALRQTIDLSAAWGAQYVVVHFGGVHSDGLSPIEVQRLADEAAAQLDAWAAQRSVSLHIEYAAYNPSFATVKQLIDLVCRHPRLHVCLDVGHLRIGAQMLGLDEWDMARALAPYTRSMHLWTTRGHEDVRHYHHVPVHPSLRPQEGWIDIPGMLDQVLSVYPECAVVFEPHDVFDPSPAWRAEGMAWVREIVDGYRRRASEE